MVALALGACGKKGSTPTATPTGPTPTPLPSGATSPPYGTAGIAYLPDGGAGGAFHGVQVIHFEDYVGNLLPAPVTPAPNVVFGGPVGPMTFNTDESDALAAMELTASGGPGPAPPFMYVQDVNGEVIGSLTPVGPPYDAAVPPTPAPSATPKVCASLPPSSAPPDVPDITGLAILGSGRSAVGLVIGPGSSGILGLTSLSDAPPKYGCFVPLPAPTGRANIQVSGGYGEVLVRGPSDLLSLSVSSVAAGYSFAMGFDDTSLGTGTVYRGEGLFQISPTNPGRALVVNPFTPFNAVLVTGLPNAMAHTSTVAIPAQPLSVAISPNGSYGVVGAVSGFYVISGLNSGTLFLNSPFGAAGSGNSNSPPYVDCNGATKNLVDVTSVGFTPDGKYLALLGNEPAGTCASGNNATLYVIAFNDATGVPPTPAPSPSPTASAVPTLPPTRFTQNNIISPPSGADYMLVR